MMIHLVPSEIVARHDAARVGSITVVVHLFHRYYRSVAALSDDTIQYLLLLAKG